MYAKLLYVGSLANQPWSNYRKGVTSIVKEGCCGIDILYLARYEDSLPFSYLPPNKYPTPQSIGDSLPAILRQSTTPCPPHTFISWTSYSSSVCQYLELVTRVYSTSGFLQTVMDSLNILLNADPPELWYLRNTMNFSIYLLHIQTSWTKYYTTNIYVRLLNTLHCI